MPHDAEATEIGSGLTRVATFKQLWPEVQVEIIPRLSVDDGIERGKLFMDREWIDEKNCQQFLDYVAQYHQVWDDKRGMFLEKPYHDFTSHAADVHRGAALVEDQMTNEEPKKWVDPNANRPLTPYG